MKFMYSFQKVLDVKTNEKKQAEASLAQAVGLLSSAEQELSELMLAKYRMQQQLVDQAASGGTMAEMISGQQYVNHLEERIQLTKRKLLEAEKRVNELRGFLTDRTVDEKVWLKAKEKAQASFRLEVERRAQHELDEMATVRSKFAR
ncbi:flagellar export protein FliJ [Paenibacillus sp. TRM 82003]|nr:flagellar export protein FliJ [Paenibacillus sp. TRM 82003]